MSFFTLNNLIVAAGWLLVLLIGLLGLVILWLIIRGKIDLSMLLSEENGKASLSRFQFLIFTFVFAMSLVLVILSQNPPGFPEQIPPSAFALMGISAGTFLASKGIQNSRDGNPEIAKARREKTNPSSAPDS